MLYTRSLNPVLPWQLWPPKHIVVDIGIGSPWGPVQYTGGLQTSTSILG